MGVSEATPHTGEGVLLCASRNALFAVLTQLLFYLLNNTNVRSYCFNFDPKVLRSVNSFSTPSMNKWSWTGSLRVIFRPILFIFFNYTTPLENTESDHTRAVLRRFCLATVAPLSSRHVLARSVWCSPKHSLEGVTWACSHFSSFVRPRSALFETVANPG